MSFSKSLLILVVSLSALSLLVTGCALTRTNIRAVSETFFHAVMAKDYEQLRQTVESDKDVPSKQAWENGSFFVDRTKDRNIQELWMKGPISGYVIDEISFEDSIGIAYRPGRLVHINFVLSGEKFVAMFIIDHKANEWYPVSNPTASSNILMWFEKL